MPQFWKDGGHYFVSYITGPAHIRLGMTLARGTAGDAVVMVRRPAVGRCGCGPVNENEVKKAVLAGVADANRTLESDWHPTEIVYVENDTPRYPLYEYCARLLVEHINDARG